MQNNWNRKSTSWRAAPLNRALQAQQCLKYLLWCLVRWLMEKTKLKRTWIQQILKSPWKLQALNLVQYATICFDSTSKSPQKHLMSTNQSIGMAFVWRICKRNSEKSFDDSCNSDLKSVLMMKTVGIILIYLMLMILKTCFNRG